MKTCINCKYEPNWSKLKQVKSEYPHKSGKCRWPETNPLPILPGVYEKPYAKLIFLYEDRSGVVYDCPAWEKK